QLPGGGAVFVILKLDTHIAQFVAYAVSFGEILALASGRTLPDKLIDPRPIQIISHNCLFEINLINIYAQKSQIRTDYGRRYVLPLASFEQSTNLSKRARGIEVITEGFEHLRGSFFASVIE